MLNHDDLRFDTEPREGETIGETAYRQIRLHIVNGQLKPGEKLKLDFMKHKVISILDFMKQDLFSEIII